MISIHLGADFLQGHNDKYLFNGLPSEYTCNKKQFLLCYELQGREGAHSGRSVVAFLTQALAWRFLLHAKRPSWASFRPCQIRTNKKNLLLQVVSDSNDRLNRDFSKRSVNFYRSHTVNHTDIEINPFYRTKIKICLGRCTKARREHIHIQYLLLRGGGGSLTGAYGMRKGMSRQSVRRLMP